MPVTPRNDGDDLAHRRGCERSHGAHPGLALPARTADSTVTVPPHAGTAVMDARCGGPVSLLARPQDGSLLVINAYGESRHQVRHLIEAKAQCDSASSTIGARHERGDEPLEPFAHQSRPAGISDLGRHRCRRHPHDRSRLDRPVSACGSPRRVSGGHPMPMALTFGRSTEWGSPCDTLNLISSSSS